MVSVAISTGKVKEFDVVWKVVCLLEVIVGTHTTQTCAHTVD